MDTTTTVDKLEIRRALNNMANLMCRYYGYDVTSSYYQFWLNLWFKTCN